MFKPQGRTAPKSTTRGQEYRRNSTPQELFGAERQGQRPPVGNQTEEAEQSAHPQATDSLIADMAKGFVAAQAQMACPPAQSGEMLRLLEKISRQLEDLQQPNSSRSPQGPPPETAAVAGQNKQSGPQPAQVAGQQQTADMQALFSKLLTTGKPDQAENQGNQSRDAAPKGAAAQTAAQALAQAQFELSQELEVSLQKLKQVISESEQLANRIGNLIGQENKSQ